MSCGASLNPTLSDCEALLVLSDRETPWAPYGRPTSMDECKAVQWMWRFFLPT
jgi:hypothetical protein